MSFFHSSVLENFPKNISIVDIIGMHTMDSDLQGLIVRLEQYKDRVFTKNERIIFTLIDTDYYASMNCVGNSIFNLFEIIANLDLSTDHMIVLANCPGVHKEIYEICDRKNLSYPNVINFVLWYTYPEIENLSYSLKQEKKFLYSCLNGRPRTHRKTLVAMLYEKQLIEQGMISYHASGPVTQINHDKSYTNTQEPYLKNTYMHLRTTVPFTRINEHLSLCKKTVTLHAKYHSELSKSIKSEQIMGVPNDNQTRWQAGFLQQSLVYISTETVGEYPYPFITEKTWKAMTNGMPFMILGAKHSLKFLKECGFKTFDNFWDESYDQIDSVYERCSRIVDNLITLRNQDWYQLLCEMEPIIQHNFNHVPVFLQTQLKQIKNIL